jgi:hypothetical protein
MVLKSGMMLPRASTSPTAPRRAARDLIEAVLDNMRRNLEPLRYSTLAPSRYLVYVHPREFARVEAIVPVLREQTERALTEELTRLNSRSPVQRYAARWLRHRRIDVQKAAAWQVEFLPDPDEALGEGDILVDSELLLPETAELGVGGQTRRLSTLRSGDHTTTRERTINRASQAAATRAVARVTYEDASGRHTFEVVKESVTIGRGGVTYPVDITITASPDVSREHARIRRDPASGGFFLIDLSTLGTTLNGRHVPAGFETIDGRKRENGAETAIPDRARIGLADTVFLDFEAAR